jgi:hypothetical protein
VLLDLVEGGLVQPGQPVVAEAERVQGAGIDSMKTVSAEIYGTTQEGSNVKL